jgi:hypothetical protein
MDDERSPFTLGAPVVIRHEKGGQAVPAPREQAGALPLAVVIVAMPARTSQDALPVSNTVAVLSR